ncbi:MAG: MBL fold metallo-hydrolase [Candidatus Wallbacteria bacterium]|nr:MBL fold metallo-hydrolase [Candidatus Wallbacteria bacterium]
MPKIKFWGTRGSIATPLPDRMRYGGDTSCVEIVTAEGRELIMDAGTGIRRLGQEMMGRKASCHGGALFISHLHWDHIQGFPFFIPIYDKHFKFEVYGPMRVDQSLEHRLKKQMSDLFFPVVLEEVSAHLEFISIVEDPIQLGPTTVIPRFQHHPQGSYGYRIEDAGKVIAYMTDNEHPATEMLDDTRILATGADLLIFDAQYTPEEYEKHRGWGHSTWLTATRVAKECGVKKLVLFHHDPDHSDDFIDAMVAEARRHFPETLGASRDLEIQI